VLFFDTIPPATVWLWGCKLTGGLLPECCSARRSAAWHGAQSECETYGFLIVTVVLTLWIVRQLLLRR
jgi:hypothetical protein